jgi:hypothetical protein
MEICAWQTAVASARRSSSHAHGPGRVPCCAALCWGVPTHSTPTTCPAKVPSKFLVCQVQAYCRLWALLLLFLRTLIKIPRACLLQGLCPQAEIFKRHICDSERKPEAKNAARVCLLLLLCPPGFKEPTAVAERSSLVVSTPAAC